jgi:hypothetical protein
VAGQPAQDLRNRGWGFALIIIILAIVANATAFSIHRATYLQPRAGTQASGAAH